MLRFLTKQLVEEKCRPEGWIPCPYYDQLNPLNRELLVLDEGHFN